MLEKRIWSLARCRRADEPKRMSNSADEPTSRWSSPIPAMTMSPVSWSCTIENLGRQSRRWISPVYRFFRNLQTLVCRFKLLLDWLRLENQLCVDWKAVNCTRPYAVKTTPYETTAGEQQTWRRIFALESSECLQSHLSYIIFRATAIAPYFGARGLSCAR